jgi:WD40 repeat protein
MRPPGGLPERVEGLAIDPAPGRGAIYAAHASELFAFDLETGAVRWRRTLSRSFYGVALAPDGQSLVAGGATIDAAAGGGPDAEDYDVFAAVWADDGRIVRVSYDDMGQRPDAYRLTIAEGPTAKVRATLRFPYLRCRPELSADGRRAVVYEDARVWGVDLDRGAILWEKEILSVGIVALSPDGARCVLTGDWNLILLDMSSGETIAELELPDRELTAVAWSPDHRRIAVGCRDGSIVLARTEDMKAAKTGGSVAPPLETVADPHTTEVSMLAFSRDAEWLASGADDGSVRARRLG